MCEISPDLPLKLSYCTAKMASFLPQEEKADALVGSLGCSKCEENTSAGLPLFYLFATTCCKDFRRSQIPSDFFVVPVPAGVGVVFLYIF